MAKIRFMYNNLIDPATSVVTANSEDTDYPLTNLKVDLFSTHYRSTGDAAEWIKIDLGAAMAVDVIAIRYHNLTAGATLTLEGNAADAWGAPTYSQVIAITDDVIIYFLASTQTFRWWRLTIADAANPDGVIKIGRPFLGSYFEPTWNFLAPRKSPIVDPSIKMYSSGGGKHVEKENTYRAPVYEWGLVNAADYASFEAMFEAVGANKAFFVCENADHATPETVTFYLEGLADNWGMGNAYGVYYQGPIIPCAEMRE